jgi:hypothetical protein
VQKTALSGPAEVSFPTQDWTGLVPGQSVHVRHYHGQSFVAIIEMKTGNSNAVWIIRDDTRTRHVIGNTEGVEILPIDETVHPHPTAEVQGFAGRQRCS